MPLEPPLHGRRLMRPVVIQDDVDRDPGLPLDLGVDLVEELEELLLPVPAVALADDMARDDVQGREQRGRPVAE